ncbi:hypothetical protein [Flavobacterium sp.]|uniref:hypothetical protein n=1 Tax=Flavobacterium sp. TaxID=239 RepID=UPI003340780F
MNDTTNTEIIRIYYTNKPSLTIESDWLIISICLLFLIVAFLINNYIPKWFNWHEMEVEISGSPKLKYKVKRNSDNLYIANRIHIELTTRKAAIPIDEKNDFIIEIYDSWYKLFNNIRDEIKTVPGNYLKDHDPTTALIGLTKKILNNALRPHLTEYQVKFRKWYDKAEKLEENKDLTPQEIQAKYADFDNLVESMKDVNKTLMDYANELDKLVKGK